MGSHIDRKIKISITTVLRVLLNGHVGRTSSGLKFLPACVLMDSLDRENITVDKNSEKNKRQIFIKFSSENDEKPNFYQKKIYQDNSNRTTVDLEVTLRFNLQFLSFLEKKFEK